MQRTTSLLVLKIYFSPLFETPNVSRAILTSQTSQYSNTAVTGSPAANPKCWSSLHKPPLPVGGAEGIRGGGGKTHKHRNIDTFTQPKNITHAMQFKVNVILKQTHDVCPLVVVLSAWTESWWRRVAPWCAVVNNRGHYWPLLELSGKASHTGATRNRLVLLWGCQWGVLWSNIIQTLTHRLIWRAGSGSKVETLHMRHNWILTDDLSDVICWTK